MAREPSPIGSPGQVRRALSTDVFHSGSRSGVLRMLKTPAAGAPISTLARS